MTAAKAQATISAAIGAGYSARAAVAIDGIWTVYVSPGLTSLDLAAISNFATANGITGKLDSVELK